MILNDIKLSLNDVPKLNQLPRGVTQMAKCHARQEMAELLAQMEPKDVALTVTYQLNPGLHMDVSQDRPPNHPQITLFRYQ